MRDDVNFWDGLSEGVRYLIVFFILLFVATALYLGYLKTFGTQFEDVRRDQYTHTQSYVEGAIRDLNNLCLELSKADAGHRSILESTIRSRYVQLDEKDIPTHLQGCLRQARSLE